MNNKVTLAELSYHGMRLTCDLFIKTFSRSSEISDAHPSHLTDSQIHHIHTIISAKVAQNVCLLYFLAEYTELLYRYSHIGPWNMILVTPRVPTFS